ncbi:MAG: hypothetical protein Kow0010_15220 [Dehalococcoidia bacterium]
MTAGTTPVARPARLTLADPFRLAWQLLINVKFALFLVGLAVVASLAGVIIPQVPAEMRSNAAARSAWLEAQRDTFGQLTGPMDRYDLFDIFHSPWFIGLWLLIIVSVTVCTVSRIRPTVRSVHRPPKVVSDRYFETAHQRASFQHPGGADAVEALLRRRRYRVERTLERDGATYLFAERFGWAQYGTFLSHLALLMLLVGGLLTTLAGFDRTLALAEGRAAAPVLSTPGADQIFVAMLDAHRGIDEQGNIIDFRSQLEVRRGDDVVRCTATVNTPCEAFGYNFHQAAFFDDLAHITVAAPDGRVLYNDVLDFNNARTAVPRFRVTNIETGRMVFDQALPQMGSLSGELFGNAEGELALADLVFLDPDPVAFGITWQWVDGMLATGVVGPGLPATALDPGDSVEAGRYRVTYAGMESIPAIRLGDLPGAVTSDGVVVVQMLEDRTGQPYLYISGVDEDDLVLRPGETARTSAGYTFGFNGRAEGSGINVRRDPGDTFIWVAVAMALVGLAVTFYVPRRRLWAKVTPERTDIAGVAERTTRFGRELRRMGAELGSADALLPEDLDDEA